MSGARSRTQEPARTAAGPYHRHGGVRHLVAAYDLGEDKLYGHIKPTKNRSKFLDAGSIHQAGASRSCVTTSPRTCPPAPTTAWGAGQPRTTSIAYTPTNSSWLNRIEVQFTAPALLHPRWLK